MTSLPPPGYPQEPVLADGEPPTRSAEPSTRKTRWGLRVLAVLAVVICLPFVVGLIAGAANNASYPSCADVDAGRAPLSAEGKCFKSDHWQAELALVLAWGTAVALLGAALASIRLLVTGRHGLMVLQCFASGVGLLVLAFLVTRA